MKRFFILTVFLAALVGCQSVDSNVTDPSAEAHGRETFKVIEFSIKDTSATKSPTPITSLSQFNVSATTTGSTGSETSKLANVVFADNNKSGVFKSDAVWPSTNPEYHFYASNVTMTHTASGQTVSISSIDKDVVCAYLASPSYKVKNNLVFNHILARVGTVSFTNLSLCTNVKLSMKYSGSGTYNIRTGKWSGVGNQSTKELTTADNDFWIIPGNYQATLTYTDANGTPQSKTLNQDFLAGKVNNISAKLDGSVVVKTEEEYEAPTFTLGTISDVPAGGGDSGAPSVTAVGQRKREKKTLADGTVKYDPDWTAVSNPDYTIQYGKALSSLSDNCPSYHGDNLGTTAKERTKLGDVYVRVKIGNKTTDKKLEVYQAANAETLGTLAVKTFSYSPKVGAAGGTASPSVTYELPYSWTSGSNGKYTTDASLSYTTVTDNAGATLNASTGVVTWAANNDTERSETERVKVSLKGKSKTKDAASTQSGDAVSSYGTPTVTLSYSGTPIAYNSTTAISPTLVVKQKVTYVSGATETKTLSAEEYTVSYSGSVTGLTVNSSTGSVTPKSNKGETIAAKTVYDVPTVDFSYSPASHTATGEMSTPTVTYSQTGTYYAAGRNATNARTATVTASVTANGKSASKSVDVMQNGDKGKAQATSAIEPVTTDVTSITYSGSATGFTLDKSTGKVTSSGNSSTSTRSITVTASVTVNDKTGTKTAKVTQAANYKTKTTQKTQTESVESVVTDKDYWVKINGKTADSKDVSVAAGSVTVNVTAGHTHIVQPRKRTRTYDEYSWAVGPNTTGNFSDWEEVNNGEPTVTYPSDTPSLTSDKTWLKTDGTFTENTSSSSRSGKITAAVKVGTTTKSSATLAVNQSAATITYKLTCTGTAVSEAVGETKTFSPTVKKQKYVNGNASGSASTVYSGVTYTIGNSSIATVTASTKKVTGVSAGSTKIYATATIDGVSYNSKDNGDSGISVTVTSNDEYDVEVD